MRIATEIAMFNSTVVWNGRNAAANSPPAGSKGAVMKNKTGTRMVGTATIHRNETLPIRTRLRAGEPKEWCDDRYAEVKLWCEKVYKGESDYAYQGCLAAAFIGYLECLQPE
jgi:hypothetical protein